MNASPVGKILVVLFFVGIVAWRVKETFYKQGDTRGQTTMLWSFYVLFALSCLIFGGTVFEFFLIDRPFHGLISWAGFAIFVLANLIRIRAIQALGRFWSLHVEIRAQHDFVREGPYRYVRHPAYLSFILEHIAVPLVGNAWWSLLVAVLVYIPMLLWRWRQEEIALCEKFGDSYRAYQMEVGALFPRLSVFRRARRTSASSS